MTGEPTHITSKERMAPELMSSSKCVSQLSISASKVQQPLRFTFSYVQPITQTELQMKNSVRIVSAINPVTTENTDDSHLQMYPREAMHHATANRHLGLSAKRNGTQRRTKVSP